MFPMSNGANGPLIKLDDEKTKTPLKTPEKTKTPEKPKPFFYDYKYERPEKIGKLNKIIHKYGDRAKPNKIPR
jgi:hypothetical protein